MFLQDVKAIQASQHGFSALVGEKLAPWRRWPFGNSARSPGEQSWEKLSSLPCLGLEALEFEGCEVQEGGESEELEDDKLVKPPRATKGDVFKEGKKMFDPFEKCAQEPISVSVVIVSCETAQEPKKRLRLRSPRNRAGG